MSNINRTDQRRTIQAYQIVQDPVTDETWRTRLRQLPAQLQGGGLCATYAYLMAQAAKTPHRDEPATERGTSDAKREQKLSDSYRRLVDGIAAHVFELRLLTAHGKEKNPTGFLNALATAEPTEYTRVYAEVNALAIMMSRLAVALYEPKPEDTDER